MKPSPPPFLPLAPNQPEVLEIDEYYHHYHHNPHWSHPTPGLPDCQPSLPYAPEHWLQSSQHLPVPYEKNNPNVINSWSFDPVVEEKNVEVVTPFFAVL